MWRYTFINRNGVVFTYDTGEAYDTSDLAFIKYSLDRDSILVGMEPLFGEVDD